MRSRLPIDGAGRLVIPKRVRDELGLSAGDTLEMERAGEAIILRPVRNRVPLVKEHGVWVFYSGHRLTTEDTNAVLDEIRDERERASLGELPE